MTDTGACRYCFGGEEFVLCPERALWSPGRATIFVADLHLAKSAVFRASGLADHEGIEGDHARLSDLLAAVRAERLVVLGDLFHAPEGQTHAVRSALARWRSQSSGIEVIVTRGNHDRACAALLEDLGIGFQTSHRFGEIECVHAPGDAPSGASSVLCGHIHPAVRLRDQTGSFRLPCFWFSSSCGVLPAFGGFTGTHAIDRKPGDRVFAIADGRVMEV